MTEVSNEQRILSGRLHGQRPMSTATLNDSRNDTGRTAFCGPTVISAITGYSVSNHRLSDATDWSAAVSNAANRPATDCQASASEETLNHRQEALPRQARRRPWKGLRR